MEKIDWIKMLTSFCQFPPDREQVEPKVLITCYKLKSAASFIWYTPIGAPARLLRGPFPSFEFLVNVLIKVLFMMYQRLTVNMLIHIRKQYHDQQQYKYKIRPLIILWIATFLLVQVWESMLQQCHLSMCLDLRHICWLVYKPPLQTDSLYW